MVSVVLASYLLAGLGLFILGPGRREVSRQVANTIGSSLTNALTGRTNPSKGKLLAFRVILTIALILIWPIFLVSFLQEKKSAAKSQKEWEPYVNEGLHFDLMGGAGNVYCEDCQFSEEITSFMHGYLSNGKACATTGYQCLTCGRFVALASQDSPLGAATPCACGSSLSRDHALFCPKCRSKKLRYEMSVIS